MRTLQGLFLALLLLLAGMKSGIIKLATDYVNNKLCHLTQTKKVNLNNAKPLITFTFDDFPASAYTTGGAILQKYNNKGTYYVAMGIRAAENSTKLFDDTMLQQLVADGHEIASHSYGHIRCRGLDVGTLESDFSKNQSEFSKVVPNYRLENFSYPYGDVDPKAKRVVNGFYSSSRSIFSGINVGTADLNLLLANKLYSKTEPIDKIAALIEENNRKNGWLIFYTHDVEENPSKYGCTPAYFEEAVKMAVASGAEIVTVKQALEKIKGSN